MAKISTRYVCSQCAYATPKWVGKCPHCGAWDTFQEEVVLPKESASAKSGLKSAVRPSVAKHLTEIESRDEPRLPTHIEEFDRVLGGGVVKGSIVLVGGEPGVGKSTLMMQAADALARSGKTLYVSGEESARQIKLRADRLGIPKQGAEHTELKLAIETELENTLAILEIEQPKAAIIDSIQSLYTSALDSAPGSVTQIRACATALQRIAKEQEIAVLLVGHVTKEGSIAGPKVLEHLVDTVLYFEGDLQGAFRILRSTKNRFGSTDEVGVFDMRSDGLIPVPNPSELLLAERSDNAPGSVIFPALEGSRSLLMEVQALTTPSFLNSPRRVITGLSFDRTNLVLAVMEKRLGFRMATHDVFVNVAGGMRVMEPAADLAILVATASVMRDKSVLEHTVVFGEVGLAGEVRGVPRLEARLREAARMGFQRALAPKSSLQAARGKLPLTVMPVKHVKEAIEIALQ
ncbi:MAG: DNA repair protein RadA [Fimbriimonadia bacterium]|nr:DNA repair protein RadA [Fimbriimonadia bacterium]